MWSVIYLAGFSTGLCLGIALMYLMDTYLEDIEPENGVL